MWRNDPKSRRSEAARLAWSLVAPCVHRTPVELPVGVGGEVVPEHPLRPADALTKRVHVVELVVVINPSDQ